MEGSAPGRADGRLGWVGRTWVLGCAAVVLVVLLTIVSRPSDLSLPGRLFVWGSTAGFSVWLLRAHRGGIGRAQRAVIVCVCGGGLAVLALVLSLSAR